MKPSDMPKQKIQLNAEQALRLARQNLNSRLRKIAAVVVRSANVDEIIELNRVLDDFADWRGVHSQHKGTDQ